MEYFNKALEMNQANDPTIYFNRGNALLSENKYKEALEDYNQAIKI